MMLSRLLFAVFSVICFLCTAFAMFLACIFLYAVIAVSEMRAQRLAPLKSMTS